MEEFVTPATLSNYRFRPAEHLHTRSCLAKAMIAAIENERDVDTERGHPLTDYSTYDHAFRLWAQDNNALSGADYYLNEGITECVCPPCPNRCCTDDSLAEAVALVKDELGGEVLEDGSAEYQDKVFDDPAPSVDDPWYGGMRNDW